MGLRLSLELGSGVGKGWAFNEVRVWGMFGRRGPHKDRMPLCACTFPYGLHGSVAADPLQNQDFLSLRRPLSALWAHIRFDLRALIGRA